MGRNRGQAQQISSQLSLWNLLWVILIFVLFLAFRGDSNRVFSLRNEFTSLMMESLPVTSLALKVVHVKKERRWPSSRRLTGAYLRQGPSRSSVAARPSRSPHREQVFLVNDSGLNLSFLSTIVYGTSKKWREIAKWNHLKRPYHIHLGQRLVLKNAPVFKDEVVKLKLRNLWVASLRKKTLHSQMRSSRESPKKSQQIFGWNEAQ
jgi:hypothetical protein